MLIRQSPEENQDQYKGWGWKEPNTHIYLEFLSKYFSDLKYIFVIRHGLDMAFSKNQAQLYNWGNLLGVKKPASPKAIPVSSLDYWIKANQRAIFLGKKFLKNRFFVINFDQLQKNPQVAIGMLLKFIQCGVDDHHWIQRLCEKIIRPEVNARYQKMDLSCFSMYDFHEVKKLGFPIEIDSLRF